MRKNPTFDTIVLCVRKLSELLSNAREACVQTGDGSPKKSIDPAPPSQTRSSPLCRKKAHPRRTEEFVTGPAPPPEKPNIEASQNGSHKKRMRTTTEAPKKIVILTTGLNKDQKQIIAASFDKIGTDPDLKVAVQNEYSANITHIISGCNGLGLCLRTVKYMRGLLDGKKIVSYDCNSANTSFPNSHLFTTVLGFLASLTENRFVPEDPFLIRGDEVVGKVTNAAKIALQHRRPNSGLFSGYTFHLAGRFTPPAPTKHDLNTLITSGGGSVQPRRHKLDVRDEKLVIIFDPDSLAHDGLAWIADYPNRAPFIWLFNCISHYEILQITR